MPKVDYEKYLVTNPAHETGVQAVGRHKGHQVPSMTYMRAPGISLYHRTGQDVFLDG